MVEEAKLNLQQLAFYFLFFMALSVQFVYDPGDLPVGFEKGKAIAVVLTGTISLIILAVLIFQGKLTRFSREFLIFLSTFIFIHLTTLVASPYKLNVLRGSSFRFQGYLEFLFIYLTGFVIYQLLRRKYVQSLWFKYGVISIFCLQAVLGIVDASRLAWSQIRQGFFVNGNFGQSNFFASAMICLILFSVILLTESIKRKRLVEASPLLITIPIAIAGLYLSFSTAGWILAPVLLLAIALAYFGNVYLLIIFIAMISIATMVAVAFINPGRRDIWLATVKLILQRPLFGWGQDTLLETLKSTGYLPGRVVDRTHNYILAVIYNFGLQILLPFSLFISSFKGLFSKKLDGDDHVLELLFLAVPIVTFLVTGLVHTKSIYHFLELAIFAGALLAYINDGDLVEGETKPLTME